ncbi:LuxE/PaaK family acyltransferase [Clostridium minihomine]|uniref:LuxE/PaaK family acyltransferase n=1 Tax=Clostridium minihomine TaxID=2045012 RepID=UPI001FB2D4B1|nr:acyl-protein synthetase [Clostridium minihomine]
MEFLAHCFESPPFAWEQPQKDALFLPAITELTQWHDRSCPQYHSILRTLGCHDLQFSNVSEIPFLPSSIFRTLRLTSQTTNDYQRTLTSSGTTGTSAVRVELDRETSALQQRALAHIAGDFLGQKRLPMLILDSPSVLRDSNRYSAKGAGILGFSIFGRGRTFALKEDMTLDVNALESFLENAGNSPFLIFGFTFIVWQYFYQALCRLPKHLDFSNGILVHGGGWKKLQDQAVPPEEFRARIQAICGLKRIHNYYGMAEQTGSIFMQCEHGRYHASSFSEVFVRRAEDFSLCSPGEPGILQVLSLLPRSYPGHSLLTEDEGILLGEDDCPCGRHGRSFAVTGRLAQAEVRGCSDAYSV